MNILLLTLIIFSIAILMTMTGRGGGNFYVLAVILAGFGMHEAATTGQFILFVSAFSATVVFGGKKFVEWRLVVFIGVITSLSAFCGGYLSDFFAGTALKFIFSFFLFLAAVMMLMPVREKKQPSTSTFLWKLKSGDQTYFIHLPLTIPVILTTGFAAGMVGVSGGSFLVPLMVLACGVPMMTAVATSTTMVSAIALAGFLGHLASGHFDFRMAVPLALGGALGGLIGSRLALKTKPRKLKILFALTTLAASVIMILNALH